jgi:hypothetical protein
VKILNINPSTPEFLVLEYWNDGIMGLGHLGFWIHVNFELAKNQKIDCILL